MKSWKAGGKNGKKGKEDKPMIKFFAPMVVAMVLALASYWIESAYEKEQRIHKTKRSRDKFLRERENGSFKPLQ